MFDAFEAFWDGVIRMKGLHEGLARRAFVSVKGAGIRQATKTVRRLPHASARTEGI
jgi:hypothetical protein